ncbi:MAG: DUF86 domain-containing protein [Flavobacteriia bacterium]|nr:DUF86 domain-containing protein [Flavobacteriia bacterium]
MYNRDTLFLLEDIIESCLKIKRYTEGLDYESFVNDDKTKDAVVRNFEIIGEVSTVIHEDFKKKHPQINWREIKDFRNRMIHDYAGIDYQIVWTIITEFIEELEFQVNQIIKDYN